MKCEWCKRTFKKGQVRKVIKGKAHTFCSESCFRLWRYDVPWFDLDKMYVGGGLRRTGVSITAPPLQELVGSDMSGANVEGETVIWEETK